MPSRSRHTFLPAAALSALLPGLANAQTANRFVVAFAPGGIADTVGRLAAQRLNSQAGRSVIVENRAGAAGYVAAAALQIPFKELIK